MSIVLTAQSHLINLLEKVFNHTHHEQALILYDTRCTLSATLAQAYSLCLPHARCLDFDMQSPEKILEILGELQPLDLTVLIQSTSFRLDAFRLRIELFKRKIKVIEHPHLSRMSQEEIPAYIDSLHYDYDYYHTIGHALKRKLDGATSAKLDSGGELLIYDSPFEDAKLNIGDYSQMNNIGGQFPLGEVFTEAQNLRAVNGRVRIFSFGDVTYKLNYPPTPITLIVSQGQVIGTENSTSAFDTILSNISTDEGVVWIRELGLGMNKAFSKTRIVGDTGTYERMCGIHLSLGAKHGIYGKPDFKRRDGKYHVDVFVDTHSFTLDNETIYSNDAWIIESSQQETN